MKIKFIVLSAFLSMALSCNQSATSKIDQTNLEEAKVRDANAVTGMPIVKFDKTEHDFGVINEGEVVETTFEIENVGTADLVITNAFATCGCTVPEWPKEPIKPKEKGLLKVSFDSNGRQNKQSKTITITTNTENGSENVSIKTFVTPKAK